MKTTLAVFIVACLSFAGLAQADPTTPPDPTSTDATSHHHHHK